jgi:hypothetical protein
MVAGARNAPKTPVADPPLSVRIDLGRGGLEDQCPPRIWSHRDHVGKLGSELLYQVYLTTCALGCNQETTKSVSDGNSVVKRPISGPTPNVKTCRQNSPPSSPGLVSVM